MLTGRKRSALLELDLGAALLDLLLDVLGLVLGRALLDRQVEGEHREGHGATARQRRGGGGCRAIGLFVCWLV